jgi:2-methylcitrate dehydratase PrpD
MAKKGTDISPIMRKLSAYIASAPGRQLPPEVAERAKHHLLDTVSAMVSGSRLLPGRRGIDYVKALGGVREACVLGTRLVTSAPNAALANGMLAHADETDDAYYIALVHPGCSVIPAALAMAERERSDGTALLRAIVLGYDICARISKTLGVEHFRSAGHSTHSFGGTFGSAAAAGALAGLDAGRVRYLLSYAAQQASGLSCWARDREHIEKAFHFGGMPARSGVTAATMVAAGFTAVDDVFSGDRGFFHAYESFAKPKRLVAGLGSEFDIMQTAIKRWPVGYPIQAPLDALSHLIDAHRIAAKDVAGVAVTIDEQGARTVNKRQMASINIQHLMAIMLIDGEITFASAHDDRRVGDPTVLALKKRIGLAGSPELSRTKTTQAVVEIVTRSGRRLRHHTRAVRGSATNPMQRDEVARKSRDLLVPVLGLRRTEALIDRIWNVEGVGDVRELGRLSAARTPGTSSSAARG